MTASTEPTQGGEPVADRSWAAMSAKHYERQVRRVADHLRTLADRVEQEGLARAARHDYGRAASQVIHAVMWGLANASLDGLISAASEADRAARTPEETP